VKHDGFRILALKQGELVNVWSGRGVDFTDRFLNIADAVRGLPADEALIDGEAVVFRDDGRSDFVALLTKRGWAEALFAAFDLLRPAATICASVRLRSGGRRSGGSSPSMATRS
jgi:bifunctional non-homologous end joining protein LigD